MKHETYAEYDPKGMALATPGLLTVWAGIQRLREDLVLVGGLVPHFICIHPVSESRLPRPGTLDVDIGIDAAIAAFGAEAAAQNAAMPDAVACLRHLFRDEDAAAPVRAAHFVYGAIDTGEGDDMQTSRQQIQQDVVTVGHALLAVV